MLNTLPRRMIVSVTAMVLAVVLGTGFGLWYHAKYAGQSVVNATRSQRGPQTASPGMMPSAPSVPAGSDVSSWKTLNNKYGWRLKYPPAWQPNGHEDNTAEGDTSPYLEGPGGCYERSQECGYLSIGIWIGSISPNDKTRVLNGLSPKDFLLATQFPTPSDPSRVLLSQGNLSVGGAPAYYLVFRQSNFENYPNGIIMKEIEVKTQGKFYSINYYETGNNKPLIASISSSNDWQLNPIFEQIISTISFSH